ncbi:MAG TPA: class I SAM-dependent methyltransferase [Myxococcota bacterium]|nr:class I SAM-dependent methyltransferase [Myxococcota bacterium]
MDDTLDAVSPATLAKLHPVSIQRPSEVEVFLERIRQQGCLLSSGINRQNDSRTATIQTIGPDSLTLLFENLQETHLPQLFLSCDLDGRRYFFAVTPIAADSRGYVHALLPQAIYQAERRDLERFSGPQTSEEIVEIRSSTGQVLSGVIEDSSYHGLGVLLRDTEGVAPEGQVTVQFTKGNRQGDHTHGVVRHSSRSTRRQGWIKIGLEVSDVPVGKAVEYERRDQILELNAMSRIQRRASLIGGLARVASARAARTLRVTTKSKETPTVIEYESAPGEPMRAVVDTWGGPRDALAVVIPPAWGRTKETLWPLAATIVETFRSARQPITVLRYDGTHRRGESFIPLEYRAPGSEYLRFTFSRAVRDIHATLEFLAASPVYRPRKVVLVTFSLAAVEGRRAVATDRTGLLAGWIPVVGMVDLQSALRTISGGIDFAYGLSRGLRFGRHELVGVVADMDRTGLDALEHKLVFLEDARRDMAEIRVPITWVHGRHDAWMDVDRVRHVMSCGDTSARRVIEVPTGHQLRTSAEAFSVFGLIATEAARMALQEKLPPRLPDLVEVDRRRDAELRRLPKKERHLREFWSSYLLGRNARFGFQLLTATSAYRLFMREQIEKLKLRPRNRVLDVGSGTGDFAVQLATEYPPLEVEIDAVDFVAEALERASARMAALQVPHLVRLRTRLLDFDPRSITAQPFAPKAYDAVLASLVISYVSDPFALLERIHSALGVGGRLVVSTLRRDADFSRLHVEGLAELRAGVARRELGDAAAESIDELARDFLNDASKILEFEEEGTFRFWDLDELRALVRRAGFVVEEAQYAFGEPPQGVLVVARRD